MSRVLRYAGAALLVVVAVGSAHSASAKVQTVSSQEHLLAFEANTRLEEIKVELALLSDVVTFPYYLGARGSAESLVLRGFVPNEVVRQRALELARRSTFLKVNDGLLIQTNLSRRSPPRPALQLQKEAAELLHKTLGEPAKTMALAVRTNGVIVITGSIDSLEGKLEVSRLFRRLSGCFGVVNELTVRQMERDGQRVVQVTRDGSLVVPPSALGLQLEPFVTSAPVEPRPAAIAPRPVREALPVPTPRPALPTPVLPSMLEAHKDDMRLPTAVLPQPKPERIGTVAYTAEEPKLPVKWTSPAPNWEAQAKKLEPINVPPSPDLPACCRPAQTVWTRGGFAKSSPPREPENKIRTASAETPATPPSEMIWRRPGATEESEPKAPPGAPRKAAVGSAAAESTLTPSAPTMSRPVRRWPPAYESKPPENKGRPGVITFDDEPPPPKTGQQTAAKASAIVPAKLQRQVKAACGHQAHDVTVEPQSDGTIVVKVKVANLSIEDQVAPKILAIPEMTTPQVRLLMDVGP